MGAILRQENLKNMSFTFDLIDYMYISINIPPTTYVLNMKLTDQKVSLELYPSLTFDLLTRNQLATFCPVLLLGVGIMYWLEHSSFLLLWPEFKWLCVIEHCAHRAISDKLTFPMWHGFSPCYRWWLYCKDIVLI